MKKLLFISSMLFIMNAAAQQKTEKFKVRGTCDQCKDRIESTVLAIKGVSFAEWDVETQMLAVTIDSQLVSVDELHNRIADAGHDTEKAKTEKKDYMQLPLCCRYQREKTETKPSGKVQDQTLRVKITGMTCSEGCAKGIESQVYKQKGVKFSEVKYETQIAHFIYDPSKITAEEIIQVINTYNPEGETRRYIVEVLQ